MLGNEVSRTPLLDNLVRLSMFESVGNFHALPLSGKPEAITQEWEDRLDNFKKVMAQYDVSCTSPILDSIFVPASSLSESLDIAAKSFGVDYAFYTSCGTTVSNRIVLGSVIKPGDRVLFDGSSHQSLEFAVMQLDLRTTTIPPKQVKGRVSPDIRAMEISLLDAVNEGKPYDVVILTASSYDGIMVKLDELIPKWANLSDKSVFVIDAAWSGIHAFSENIKEHTIVGLAKTLQSVSNKTKVIATVSLHKSMYSLRQASAILVVDSSEDLRKSLETSLYVHHTTSPSWLIIASAELAVAHAISEGDHLFERSLSLRNYFLERLRNDENLNICVDDDINNDLDDSYLLLDPLKILINAECFGDLTQLRRRLFNEYGVYVSRCIRNKLLLNFNIGLNKLHVDKMILGMRSLLKEQKRNTVSSRRSLPELGSKIKDYVIVYPPGIPMAYPGEIWQEHHVQKLCEESDAGSDIFLIPVGESLKGAV